LLFGPCSSGENIDFVFVLKVILELIALTSYFPMLFKKDILTDPIGFLKNHLPEPEELE